MLAQIVLRRSAKDQPVLSAGEESDRNRRALRREKLQRRRLRRRRERARAEGADGRAYRVISADSMVMDSASGRDSPEPVAGVTTRGEPFSFKDSGGLEPLLADPPLSDARPCAPASYARREDRRTSRRSSVRRSDAASRPSQAPSRVSLPPSSRVSLPPSSHHHRREDGGAPTEQHQRRRSTTDAARAEEEAYAARAAMLLRARAPTLESVTGVWREPAYETGLSDEDRTVYNHNRMAPWEKSPAWRAVLKPMRFDSPPPLNDALVRQHRSRPLTIEERKTDRQDVQPIIKHLHRRILKGRGAPGGFYIDHMGHLQSVHARNGQVAARCT